MLLKRFLSAVLGIILFVIFVLWGSFPFFLLVVLISIIGTMEFADMLKKKNIDTKHLLIIYIVLLVTLTYIINSSVDNSLLAFTYYVLLISFFIYNLIYVDKNFIATLSSNLLGLIYIGGGMVFLILLRDFNITPLHNTRAIWLVLLVTWAADTGAYFCGLNFGKHKLARDISPNKTIEGAVGGILLAVIIVSIYTYFLGIFSFSWFIYSILAAVISMLGDLFESAIKRSFNIKDSGDIIPGHGGILDRFDGILFSAPFTYLYLILFLG